jgi:hypothetical protein
MGHHGLLGDRFTFTFLPTCLLSEKMLWKVRDMEFLPPYDEVHTRDLLTGTLYMYVFIVTFLEVIRHRHVSRLVVDSRSRGNESKTALQRGRQSVISLRSTRGHFRPDPEAHREE